jgi:hypothetical protein
LADLLKTILVPEEFCKLLIYDMNHEKVIYTASDFIEFVIDNAKTKMSSFYLENEFKELNTIEKLKKSIDMLGLYEFKDITNEFIRKVEKNK